MMRGASLLQRLCREERAVALVEFALTAPLFLLVLMGIFDYSWQMYAQQVLQGSVSDAGRDATLEIYAADQNALDTRVRDQVQRVFPSADVSFSRKAYDQFSEVGVEERYTDANGNGSYDVGECYDDSNGNGRWDPDRGRTGNGGADDIVLYTASMTFDRVLPVWRMLGQPQSVTLSYTTVLRNQPFASGSDAPPDSCP